MQGFTVVRLVEKEIFALYSGLEGDTLLLALGKTEIQRNRCERRRNRDGARIVKLRCHGLSVSSSFSTKAAVSDILLCRKSNPVTSVGLLYGLLPSVEPA